MLKTKTKNHGGCGMLLLCSVAAAETARLADSYEKPAVNVLTVQANLKILQAQLWSPQSVQCPQPFSFTLR